MAVVAALASPSVALPAAAGALTPPPPVTFEGNGATISPFGSRSPWCTFSGTDSDLCTVVDVVPDQPGWLGTPIGQVAYPFTGVVHFGEPVESVRAGVSGADHVVRDTPVTIAQLDADSWSFTVPGPVADPVQLWFGASFPRPAPGAEVGKRYGGWSGLVRLEPVPPVTPPPLTQPLPPVVSTTTPEQAPSITLLGATRRGASVVVRVRTNVAGALGGGVRQAGRVRRITRARLPAGTHRLVVAVPRPRTRAATVTLRLTDAAGRSARVARTLR